MAVGNWQAKLAAMMVCIAESRRVCLLPNYVCWMCVCKARLAQSEMKHPVVYIH